MPDLKLIKNPGYTYDLLFLFYYKYNCDLIPALFEVDEEEMERFSEMGRLFEPISEDLYVFFRFVKPFRCFFTVNYFDNCFNAFIAKYDLDFVLKQLNDYDALIKNLIKHYFDELSEEQVNDCIASTKCMFEIIKKSSYDDKLKTKLYEFFIDPESHIRLLQYELMAKEVQLAAYYEKNYAKILNVYNELNFDLLVDQFSFLEDQKHSICKSDTMYLSFCLLNHRLVRRHVWGERTLLLLGVDFFASLQQLKKKRMDIVSEQFGAALSDATRVRMLEVIAQKGKCTCKMLAAELDLAPSTAYHHVSMLERCALVESNMVGKSFYYKINRKYFSALIDYFKKFAEPEENHS